MKIYIYLFVWISILNWNLSNGYKNTRLQDNLCADDFLQNLKKTFTGNPTMTLSEDRESAAIIAQTWNVTMPGHRWSNKLKYDCRFRVQTSKHRPRGIYIIITRLKFRQRRETGECLDFIQFLAGNRAPSERICNDIAIDGAIDRFKFDERDRDVNVHIHIDKEFMISEPLELRMVLTAHSECRYTGDLLCNPKDPYSCISRHLVCDNVTNCMNPYRDEVSCFYDDITTMDVDTTNVALSAITSMIFTMVGVGFCIWICWKYWNCITVQQHAHEASAAAHQRAPRDAPTIDIPTAPSFDDGISSAEPHQQQQLQPQTPKDLPPSYESLFPDR